MGVLTIAAQPTAASSEYSSSDQRPQTTLMTHVYSRNDLLRIPPTSLKRSVRKTLFSMRLWYPMFGRDNISDKFYLNCTSKKNSNKVQNTISTLVSGIRIRDTPKQNRVNFSNLVYVHIPCDYDIYPESCSWKYENCNYRVSTVNSNACARGGMTYDSTPSKLHIRERLECSTMFHPDLNLGTSSKNISTTVSKDRFSCHSVRRPRLQTKMCINIKRTFVSREKVLRIALQNCCSVRNKSHVLHEYLVDNNLDIFVLTETWLGVNDSIVINDLCPVGFSCINIPRGQRRGGGIGIVHRSEYSLQKTNFLQDGSFKSFEYVEVTLKGKINRHIAAVYRPPPSRQMDPQKLFFLSNLKNFCPC